MTLDDVTRIVVTVVSLALSVPAVAAWLAKWLTKHQRLAQVLGLLYKLVEAEVANAYQTRVKALQDPTKPGQWTPAAAADAKAGVIAAVKAMVPDVIRETQALGLKQLDPLLSSYVEQSVVSLNAQRLPASVAGTATEKST